MADQSAPRPSIPHQTPMPPAMTPIPEPPRLELDQLLAQLVDRAQEVIATQDRLRGLLRAHQTVIADLAPATLLRRIVESARDLVGARYAALGVLDGVGGLADFVHVGMPQSTVDAIGRLPQGKGLLGALIAEPRSIRLDDLGTDPRSSGLPENHPPMTSFLGVPVQIRDEVFGILYFTDAARGHFTADDEELVRSLAATAAVVVDNSRQYDAARRRGDWLAASAFVTRQTLALDADDPLGAIAEHAHRLTDADLVAVLLPDEERATMRVATARTSPRTPPTAAELVGHQSPVGASLCAHVLTTGEPLMLADAHEHRGLPPAILSAAVDAGPVLVVPLTGERETRGVLAVARLAGRPTFRAEDLEMAAGFANQASVALELADARAERERVAMLDDRDRIAGDLHDHIIQRLFAVGLAVQGIAARVDGPAAKRLGQVITDLDETIAQIRTSIFALHNSQAEGEGLRGRILDVVSDAATALGHTPLLRISGPVDTLVGGTPTEDTLVDDLVAVVREALSNVAKHAHASRVEVDLAATAGSPSGDRSGVVSVVVVDDGVGPGNDSRSSGVASMRRRAENHHGAMTLEPAEPTGTRLTWSVPLPAET